MARGRSPTHPAPEVFSHILLHYSHHAPSSNNSAVGSQAATCCSRTHWERSGDGGQWLPFHTRRFHRRVHHLINGFFIIWEMQNIELESLMLKFHRLGIRGHFKTNRNGFDEERKGGEKSGGIECLQQETLYANSLFSSALPLCHLCSRSRYIHLLCLEGSGIFPLGSSFPATLGEIGTG